MIKIEISQVKKALNQTVLYKNKKYKFKRCCLYKDEYGFFHYQAELHYINNNPTASFITAALNEVEMNYEN